MDREAGTPPARGRYLGRRGAVRNSTRDDYRQQIERVLEPLRSLGIPD